MQKYVLKQKIARAKAGDADEQYELGKAYLYGEDIKRNVKKGEKYLLLAAAQRHVEAQFELGKFYLESDAEKAENWLGRAANNGSNEAAYLMGLQFYDGKHASRNADKAALWYGLSAKRGHIPSIAMLGTIYNRGSDVRLKTEAEKLLKKAAEQGYAEAQYELARSCYGKNIEKAVFWLEKSAKGNYYPAYEQLAYFYAAEQTDEGFKKALKALTVAAENGSALAAYQLGNCYFKGWGTGQDLQKAKMLWRQSAEQGCEEAEKALKQNFN